MIVPAVLIVFLYKLYINRAYLQPFRYFTPRQEDLATIAQYSANTDAKSNKLERRFGHPALHTELFTPMLHQKMIPLLREVYKGRIDENEEKKPFMNYEPVYGGGGAGMGRAGGVGGVGSAPGATPTSAIPGSPGGLSIEVMSQVLFDVLFRGVDQVNMIYHF